MGNHRIIAFASAVILISLGMLACHSISTPTKAMQTYWYAMKNKDIKALKSVMKKDVLDRGEKEAKAQNKTNDDMLRERLDFMEKYPSSYNRYTLETRNETIASDGKTATIEVKINPDISPRDRWERFHFVKEDDGWKIEGFSFGPAVIQRFLD